MPKEVTDLESFKTELKNAGSKAVFVDFYAQWCGPCKVIAPHLEQKATEVPSIVVLKVDVDEADDIAQEYKIECMPTFILFQNEGEVERFSGANKDKINEVFEKYK